MYCIPEDPRGKNQESLASLKNSLVIVCIDCWINKDLSPLPRGRRHVCRTSLNLCVDRFSLLVVVPATLIVFPAELSLRQLGGFLKVVVVVVSLLPRTAAHNEWCQSHPRFDVGSSVDSKASVADWRWSCVDLGSELGLFVGSCVDLQTACRLLEESIWRNR